MTQPFDGAQDRPFDPAEGRLMMEAADLRHALQGVRVLDLSSYLAGPVCPKLMADMGADVIKLESLEGDGLRSLSAGFLGWNPGKRCIAVDLKQPEGRAIAHKLAAQADVVVENMRPGVAERLGVGYEQLRALNPRLIYCTVTAYGSQGPYAHKPGVDPLLQARSGVERAQGGEENPPVFLRVPVCDYATAMLACVAVCMALYHRARTGQGQRLETSLLNTGIFVNSDAFTRYQGRPKRRLADKEQWGLGALYRIYPAQDGWLLLAALGDGHWEGLSRALSPSAGLRTGGPELVQDSRFASAEARREHDGALAKALESLFRERPAAEWEALLEAEGVSCAPVSEEYHRSFFTDPHALANDLVAVHQHPILGELKQAGLLVKLSETPGVLQGPAPLLGQHTVEILEELGYSQAEIQILKERKVVTWGEER